ncbi:aldolase/citrate lyase family protein, partial [Natronococcus sp.]|uniref:aldolase/citrate lyase family protein n=1 Tax=Natronococcus sp. TaxID=35747 RepID=UPI003A4DA7E5
MVRRSLLFTPGDRPEMLRKAPGAGADAIVFDLEDAVSPGRKDEAREAVRNCLADPAFDPDPEVCVRVNAERSAIERDLEALAGADSIRLDSVMLPKATAAADVRELAAGLEERGLACPVLALIENAAG